MLVSTASAAEPETLTLACQGTTTEEKAKPKPISLGIIINFTAGTVEGFNTPAKIAHFDQVTISFDATREQRGNQFFVAGSIDRVTGDANALSISELVGGRTIFKEYALKCRPAQRMF